MGKSKAPKAPDPKETAAAQTASNIGTSVANAWLGNVNQVTPEGTLSFDQTGTYQFTDPNGKKVYDIPTFTATQSLSPEQQKLYDLGMNTQQNLAQIGVDQSGRIRDLLGSPIELSNEAVEQRLFDLGRQRLDPVLQEREEGLRQKLADQGIQEGSRAFDRAMGSLYEGSNDAYNQLLLSGRGQALQELLTMRNQPINEITALLSNSQVSQPNFVNAQMPTIANTDVGGITNQAYQNELAGWQANQQMGNNLMGGLFQLGSAGIMAY